MRYGLHVKLDKPLLGCTEARVYLDEMRRPKCPDARKTPHRLLFNMGIVCRRKESAIDTVKVEKELDIGDDCTDKLAKAMRRESDGNVVRRKKPTKP